jgi:hypothetical protein
MPSVKDIEQGRLESDKNFYEAIKYCGLTVLGVGWQDMMVGMPRGVLY